MKENKLNSILKALGLILALLLAISVNEVYTQKTSLDTYFDETNSFFNKYVIDGGVAYYALRDNSATIKKLADMTGQVDLSNASADEKKAFYINAYNIIAIYSVIKHDIDESVMNRDAFFEEDTFNIAGEELTLNELENKKLRETYKDPRIHFVLVCAAQSCPRLRNFAFYPDRLDSMLEAATYDFINNPDKTKVKPGEQTIYLSSIMKWFKDDFLWEASSLMEYVNKYRLKKVPGSYAQEFYEYDWSLNSKMATVE